MNLSLLSGTEFLYSFHNAIILCTVPCQPDAGFISSHWLREGAEFLHVHLHSSVWCIRLGKRNTEGKGDGDGDKKRNILFIIFPRGTFPVSSYSFLKVNLYPATSLSATQEHRLSVPGCTGMLLGAAR